jgi:hypothetical protein
MPPGPWVRCTIPALPATRYSASPLQKREDEEAMGVPNRGLNYYLHEL